MTASQTDAAGNIGTSAANTFTVDTTAPIVTMTRVNGATVTFAFLTNANVTSIGGACTTGDGAVSVSITGIATQSRERDRAPRARGRTPPPRP